LASVSTVTPGPEAPPIVTLATLTGSPVVASRTRPRIRPVAGLAGACCVATADVKASTNPMVAERIARIISPDPEL
jgi:hypothetical protein